MKTKTCFVGATTLAAIGCTTLFARDASAAGYALDVQSARGTGMAAAQTAMTDDSSAIFYNPAGIARGKVVDAQLGVSLISPIFSYTSPGGTKTSLPFSVVPPFQAYVSGGITDDLSIGLGVFTPFGLVIKWPDGWAGRSQITQSSLAAYNFNPTVAYKLGPVRIGAGFQLTRATVELKKDINFGGQEGNADLGASAWGVGGNVGVQVDAVKQYLTFGVHYRSAVKTDFDNGKAHFGNVPRELATTIHDQAVTTTVTNPDSLAMGVSSRPIKNLIIDFDAVWIGWSHFQSINLTYPNDATHTLNSTQPKNWHDTVNFHIGAEGILSEHVQLRGGVLFDPTPSPDNTLTPDLPDSSRVNLAIGGTYKMDSGLYGAIGYQLIVLLGKTSTAPNFPGDYGGLANVLGLTIGYSTPVKKEEAMNALPPPDTTQGGGEPPPQPVPVAPDPTVQPPPPM